MFIRQSTYNALLLKCKDHENEIAYMREVELPAKDQTIREMADTIRNADQLIFQMSQYTSWDQMRPLFNKLQVGQESRQRAESNRISKILRTELISVYTKPSKP